MTTEKITIDTGTDQLLCEIRDGVALITLNRPEARNAMSPQLTPALSRMIQERGEDPRVGALLITGAGTAFCAGGDVKGMGDNSSQKSLSAEERAAGMIERHRRLTGALVGVRKPTIAALPGAAAGAGLAIALACDIRIAAKSAFVSAGYSRIGLSGDYGVAWLLTRAVGSPIAREMMFTSERVDSERAERIGLFNRVVDDARLQEEAFALARSIAQGPAVALRLMKDNLDEARDIDHDTAVVREAQRLAQAAQTEDHREAVRAFVEKRKPVFSGR
ncbi:MAG: enoyl-CoA hydratase/isomerase family protein [Burkholderiaceae bacterium]|nr:enoyl-CoA hydratase/isomerase family protein [Burkholderiaceae bacterium]MBP8305891.1 enoyl-CoA hydratase/isomerase family protein [Burkholderiaceae bacterium]